MESEARVRYVAARLGTTSALTLTIPYLASQLVLEYRPVTLLYDHACHRSRPTLRDTLPHHRPSLAYDNERYFV